MSRIDYYDIILFVETSLNENFNNAELGFHNYNVYWRDRDNQTTNKAKGGGVLIAVRKKYSSVLIKPKYDDPEQTFVGIDNQGYKIIVLWCCYIPPHSQTLLYKKHCESVVEILDNNLHDKVILAGDYNIPHARRNFAKRKVYV